VYESDIVRYVFDGVDDVLRHVNDPVEELEQDNASGGYLHGDKG
jgi:hypothetical protein